MLSLDNCIPLIDNHVTLLAYAFPLVKHFIHIGKICTEKMVKKKW